MASFRLPKACIKEVEALCSAFLWSGPELNSHKSKLAWEEVCCPKREGDLGLRRLAEINLIRDLVQPFHKVAVKSGSNTSFWFDDWSLLGRIIDITGTRGPIDLGIPIHSSMAMVFNSHNHRHHRSDALNSIENAIRVQKESRQQGPDQSLWRRHNGDFKPCFQSLDVWDQIRIHKRIQDWSSGIWFNLTTPKYAFFAWLALRNRLSTLDRMSQWNTEVNPKCLLCGNVDESRTHMFFTCAYSTQVWSSLSRGLLGNRYTSDWHYLVQMLTDLRGSRIEVFLYRYTFQTSIYFIWQERNHRRHGDSPLSARRMVKLIDKTIRNRISIARTQDAKYEEGMIIWLKTRL